MATQHLPATWQSSLPAYWSHVTRFGDVPSVYSSVYDRMCREGDDCMEEVIQQLIVNMAKEMEGVQGMTEDQMLLQPARTFLLESYYSMQLMYFPFYHETQNLDSLEPDERQEAAKFTEPFQVAIRCLEEWLQDGAVKTIRDIKGTPKEDTYNKAFQQITDQVSKATENMKQTVESMESMTETIGSLGTLLECSNLIAEHSQESIQLSRQTIQFAKRIIEISQMVTKTPDVLTEVRQLFGDMRKNVARAKDIHTSIKEVCPTYQFRDSYTEEQLLEFRQVNESGRVKETYTDAQVQEITRCNLEKSLWRIQEYCDMVIQTAKSILGQ